jgi:hypothetical protein
VPFPEPYAGLVIRYSYLWKREQQARREEGTKDRPCAVVMAIMDQDGGMGSVGSTHHAQSAPRSSCLAGLLEKGAIKVPPKLSFDLISRNDHHVQDT